MFKWVIFLTLLHCSFGDNVVNNKQFPSSFMFGVATAAYQIEGAVNDDGKSPTIWDTFIHADPSRIADGSNADIADDSYHLYETDVELLKSLGVSHYRFSLSWSRVLPEGFKISVNSLGIEYYKSLIKLLKDNNIEPIVTLYHWDLPQALQDYGGFLNESLVDWFADYAELCFETFGEDVKYWSTFNEPRIMCWLGYGLGVHAPGYHSPAQGEYVCGHNLLKAHAKAWHIYDEQFRENQGGKISINIPLDYYGPASNSAEDVAASEQAFEYYAGMWVDPLYYGDYPENLKARIANRSLLEGFDESRLPEFTEEEKTYVKGTVDYLSINTYYNFLARAISEPEISSPSADNDLGVELIDITSPNSGWGVRPMLSYVQKHYGDPDMIITENGLNSTSLEDDDKITFLKTYLSGIRDAIDEGVKIFGYTVWSLLDTFEWNGGYTVRNGLHHVDYESSNRTRTPRNSAHWYKTVTSTYCVKGVCDD